MFKTMTGVINSKTKPKPEEIAKIPSFIFCRWLSGNQYTIMAANQFNFYHRIPIENQYQMIKSVFADKIKYIPYPKKDQLDESTEIKYLCAHFKINEHDAKEYLELIDKDELKQIVQMYSELEDNR